jgi:hypothetical protein
LVYILVSVVGGIVAGVYEQSVGRRLSFSLGKYAKSFRPKYLLPWPVYMTSKPMEYQRNTLVFDLIVWRP